MLSELRAEHRQIEEAILVLQRVATGGGGKRRGRPPKWMTQTASGDASSSAAPTRTRKPFSAATRKRMAEAQRKRWAVRRAKAA
jgi:hypothetical protein